MGSLPLRPRFWAGVVDATGWPRLVVFPLMVVSLVTAVYSSLPIRAR